MRALTICMLTSSYPKYRGETTAPFIEEIAAGLVRRGHTVHVVAPFHRDVQREPIERGVHLHFFRYSPTDSLNVWGYAESLKADVGLRGRVLAAAPLALSATLFALLRTTCDLLHAHWVLPNAVPAAIVAQKRRLPLVVSLHGSDVYMAERALPLTLAAASVFRCAAGVTACSSDLRERALRLGARIDSTQVIPYGVDIQSFRPDPLAGSLVRDELGLPPDTPLILAIGRLVYKKGFTYLLEAFAQVCQHHPQAVLVIVGYGDLREELERRAYELGIDGGVRFTGQLEREQASRYISAANIYVVPSIRDQGGNVDGLPNTLLEGMAAGRPIIASRIAGIPDVIVDGKQGLLVPERDATALASGIRRLLDDPMFAQRLGQAARQRVLEELTWDQTAARVEQVYERAMKSKKSW